MDCIEFVVLILQECHAHGDGQAYDDLRDGSDFIQPGPEESVYGFDMLQDCLKVISSVNTELYCCLLQKGFETDGNINALYSTVRANFVYIPIACCHGFVKAAFCKLVV